MMHIECVVVQIAKMEPYCEYSPFERPFEIVTVEQVLIARITKLIAGLF